MTTMPEKQVILGTDDANSAGAVYPGYDDHSLTNGGFPLGSDSTNFWNAGFRYQSIPIPKGATIDSATISIYCSNSTWDDANARFKIFCQNNSNPPTFNISDLVSNVVSGAPGYRSVDTNVFVDWTISGLWTTGVFYTSPDIKSLIQPIVNMSDWTENNSIVVLFRNYTTSLNAGRRYTSAFESAGCSPKLNISFTTATNFFSVINGEKVNNSVIGSRIIRGV